jgi:hypothetical protein
MTSLSRLDRPAAERSLPVGLWLLWTAVVVAAAIRVAWPALWGAAPLDIPGMVIQSALAGVSGLVVITLLEIRLAPWRFLRNDDQA